MASRANLVHQTSVSTGPGAFALTAVNGRNNFAAAYGIGGSAVFWYFITNRQTVEWEVGVGHMSAAGILERDAVIQNHLGTLALVNFAVGTKDITSDIPAQEIDNVYGVLGITHKPGSDINTDLISVDVGGAPRLRWNEGQDRFEWTHALIAPGMAGGLLASSTLILRSTLGVGTTDSIDFIVGNSLLAGRFNTAGVFSVFSGFMEFGGLGDTSLSRVSPGDLTIEGNIIYRAGGTDIPTGDIADAAITYAKLQNGGGASVVGRASGSAGVQADISASADGDVLVRNTTFLQFKKLDTINYNDDSVTFAKTQNIATARLLGRTTAATGNIEEVPLDDTLEFSGANLQRAALTGAITAGAGNNATLAVIDLIIVIGDNVNAISTGVKGYVPVDFGGTITGWSLIADASGSIVIDVWKDTWANAPPDNADSIAGSEKPTLSSAQKAQDLSLSTWTTNVNPQDVFGFEVESATTVKQVTLSIRITKDE